MKLKEHVEQLLPGWRNEWRTLVKEHGDKKVSEVTVKAFFSGMRGVKIVPCDTSEVPPDKGMTVRGHMLKDIVARGTTPEELFYLMVTGEWPDEEGLADIKQQFKDRSEVPQYVWDVIDAMPADSHPMNLFSLGILALERESVFRQRYAEGMKKEDYWDATLEDGMNLFLSGLDITMRRDQESKRPRVNKPGSQLDRRQKSENKLYYG
jgi:citrate synthase